MSSRAALALLIGLVVLCCAAVGGIFVGEAAEHYPAFSTLRNDAKGTEVLYEALQRLPGKQVTRNFIQMENFRSAKPVTVVVDGIDSRSLSFVTSNSKWLERFEAIAADGHRVLLAFDPHLRADDTPQRDSLKSIGVLLKAAKNPWPMTFEASAPWRVVYKNGAGEPVLIERAWGSGLLVLFANTDSLTNLAMVRRRNIELLDLLFGHSPRIVFDESEHGIVESGSMVGLARHYRLQGFFVGTAILAGLFLWYAASSFPPRNETDQPPRDATADSLPAFSRMLERHIPIPELLAACWTQREKAGFARVPRETIAAARQVVNERPRDLLSAFRKIQQLLHSSKQTST